MTYKVRASPFAILAVAVVVAAGILAGSVVISRRRATHDLTGTITLRSSLDISPGFNSPPGVPCHGDEGYSDLVVGAGVTVTDEGGQIVGSAALDGSAKAPDACVFTFTVPSVPRRSFYKVEVSHRGGVTYSYSQMQSAHWSVALSI